MIRPPPRSPLFPYPTLFRSRARADQRIHVENIRIGWVLGAGAGPQQALGLRPRRRERPPLPPLQQLVEPGVGKLRVRDRDLAAQARGCPALRVETPVYFRIDATYEERRDRCDPVDRLPGFAPRFEGPHIGLGDLPVVLE